MDEKKAIICDIDGTLALRDEKLRSAYDFSKANTDKVNKPVAEILRKFKADGYWIIITTGRSRDFHLTTFNWLKDNNVPFDLLYMRDPSRTAEDGNQVKDAVIKEEIYRKYIKDNFDVFFVIDDRLQVCRLWHKLGLTLFRVGDPDATF